jgi:hypothetical protein
MPLTWSGYGMSPQNIPAAPNATKISGAPPAGVTNFNRALIRLHSSVAALLAA